jgi:hypothetical protein
VALVEHFQRLNRDIVLHNKKTMNKFIAVLAILLIPAFSFGQIGQGLSYKSQEQDEYYQKLKNKPFEPLSKKKILSFVNAHYDVRDISDYTPYSDSLYLTPYQESFNANDRVQYNLGIIDPKFLEVPELVGVIDKYLILKHEKRGEVEAFIYLNKKYENKFFGEFGIWVAYSINNGDSWEYLYTGIVQKQPLCVKWYSKLPLINSKNELQIEACILRQLSPFTHSLPGATYELLKDGLLLTLDLNSLRKDTDSDGLSDIVEPKFYTDIDNKDTDGDGIFDNLDLNPRLKVQRTDKTVIYESAVNEEISYNGTADLVNSSSIPQINYAKDKTETVLIVTDNPDIQSVQPKYTRVIIISEKEYEKSKGGFGNELNDMTLSPLFKVDNEIDTYIFKKRYNGSVDTYSVKKTNDGWGIEYIIGVLL